MLNGIKERGRCYPSRLPLIDVQRYNAFESDNVNAETFGSLAVLLDEVASFVLLLDERIK